MNNMSPFSLLSDDPNEVQLLAVKSRIMILITRDISENNISQAQADSLGISQEHLNIITAGQITSISIDDLVMIAGKLGFKVTSTLAATGLTITFAK